MNNIIENSRILVIVSHDLNIIRKTVNRTIVLRHDKIHFDGQPEEAISVYMALVESAAIT